LNLLEHGSGDDGRCPGSGQAQCDSQLNGVQAGHLQLAGEPPRLARGASCSKIAETWRSLIVTLHRSNRTYRRQSLSGRGPRTGGECGTRSWSTHPASHGLVCVTALACVTEPHDHSGRGAG
jgi:hypothetical protein